ncbi:nitrilase family protein [Desulfotomaculum nigrificans]|uniref:nitrilase family protein n=1 Tax=Desulfotomaculum nigrificans TaxID=1565 RepID=UPI0001FAE7E8|nr:nitrilase family protein [Desulfotomaculum nigrificans]
MQDLKIAVVQMESKLGQVQENLNKINHFISEAALQKVNIICFPEMCLPGYTREMAAELAIDLETSDIITNLKKTAQEKDIVILVGLAEKNATHQPFITQVVIHPNGTIDKYRKTHLGKSEQPYFTPGNEIKTYATVQARFGIQICWDMHFPEMTTILSLAGAEIIFAPHASPSMVGDRRGIWLKYLAARAYDNTVFVAACNLVGDDGQGHRFCGGTLVLDPKGNIVAEDFRGREAMLITDLKAAKINKIRGQKSSSMANSFYLTARRPELYGALLTNPKG